MRVMEWRAFACLLAGASVGRRLVRICSVGGSAEVGRRGDCGSSGGLAGGLRCVTAGLAGWLGWAGLRCAGWLCWLRCAVLAGLRSLGWLGCSCICVICCCFRRVRLLLLSSCSWSGCRSAGAVGGGGVRRLGEAGGG